MIWRCNHKFDGGEKCCAPYLDEGGSAITEKQAKKEQIEWFLAELERQDGVATEFDEEQWVQPG